MLHHKDKVIRLLYIDDEEGLRNMVSEMFKRLGYQVMCAENGRQGVEKARIWQPDCILTDFHMPVMNGDRVISELRATPATSRTPIFVLSASVGAEDASLQAGANQVFSKPANLYDLNLVIRETLANSIE